MSERFQLGGTYLGQGNLVRHLKPTRQATTQEHIVFTDEIGRWNSELSASFKLLFFFH